MGSSLTPEQRSIRARIAAHARWAKEDPKAHTAKMRQAFEERFLDEVDPDRTLPEAERDRRAEHARKAYYQRLALKSAKARSSRAAG